MVSNNAHRSLSGSFRLTNREYGAINYLRFTRGLNIQNIANVLKRSVATVHRVTSMMPDKVDHRGQKRTMYDARMRAFNAKRVEIACRIKLWLEGVVDSLYDAFAMNAIPIAYLSENSDGEEDEDPA